MKFKVSSGGEGVTRGNKHQNETIGERYVIYNLNDVEKGGRATSC